jgi:hypothetical protein
MNNLKAPSTQDVNNKITSPGGKMGDFLGIGENGSINIAGIVIILLVVVGGILTFVNFHNSEDYWKIVSPLITLAFGYLFGKNKK